MNTIASSRAWRDSVLDALARLAGRRKNDVIERQAILADELGRIIAETHSAGATPDQTLSRVLQDLRDEGLLEFLGGGRYRLLNRPVDVETSDLSDQELDEAISRRLLRIGAVSTGDAVAETRCRRG